MIAFRCRRRLLHQVVHRPSLLPWRSMTQNALLRSSAGRFPGSPCSQSTLWQIHSTTRPLLSNGARRSSTSSSRLDEEGLETPIEDEEARHVVQRAKEVWPCLPTIPIGWSCAWENWAYLLTFYWLSPYYLMLPQIEMIVNINHRIPGETRPLLFSNEKQAFVFTLVDDDTKFYMYDGVQKALFRFEGVSSEQALVSMMNTDYDAMPLEKVAPDPEGEDALQRILKRDESVIPLLAEKFLDYTPEPTHPWEESADPGEREFTEEEEARELAKLVDDVERELGPMPETSGYDMEDTGAEKVEKVAKPLEQKQT